MLESLANGNRPLVLCCAEFVTGRHCDRDRIRGALVRFGKEGYQRVIVLVIRGTRYAGITVAQASLPLVSVDQSLGASHLARLIAYVRTANCEYSAPIVLTSL
jgi:hypothetical protein